MRTAIDIVIELIRTGSIPNDDAKILLDAINQKGGTQFIHVPYENPNPYSPPYRPGDVWYYNGTNTNTNATTDNKTSE